MLEIHDFGRRLSQLRRKAHLTQKELGRLCRVSSQAISKWERGYNCPDILIIDELASALGVPIEELFSFGGEVIKSEVDKND